MRIACAFLVMLFFGVLPAGAQIARPQLGYVLDSGGALRPVFGVAAAAALGDPALDNAISFACSAKICLAETGAALISFTPGVANGGQSVPVSSTAVTLCATCAGRAVIAVDNFATGGSAWIYFQASHQLARWHDGVLTALDFAPSDFASGGEILSLRATADGFDYAIVRDRLGPDSVNVWIGHYSASDGSVTVLDSVAIDPDGAAPAVMLLDGGILLSSMDNVVLRRPDGRQLTFPVAGARAFHAAGKGYVEIAASDGLWILRTEAGREQLSMLPGASIGAITRATPGAITRATRGAITGATQGAIEGATQGAIKGVGQ